MHNSTYSIRKPQGLLISFLLIILYFDWIISSVSCACFPGDCQNGGSCSGDGVSCICSGPWTGTYCEITTTNHCLLNKCPDRVPCMNTNFPDPGPFHQCGCESNDQNYVCTLCGSGMPRVVTLPDPLTQLCSTWAIEGTDIIPNYDYTQYYISEVDRILRYDVSDYTVTIIVGCGDTGTVDGAKAGDPSPACVSGVNKMVIDSKNDVLYFTQSTGHLRKNDINRF